MKLFEPPEEPAATVTCETCGFNLPADAQFCGYDGTKLNGKRATDKLPVKPIKKKCSKCRREYPGYAKFCGVDGADLYAIAMPESEIKAAQKPVDKNEAIKKDAEIKADALPGFITGDRVTRSLSGTTLDNKYVLEGVLAEGGMAILYRAHHKQMDREVCIKVIHGALAANPSAIERFQRECLLAAKLNHPNIVYVFDVGFIRENEPYLVMELIKGESLAQKISRQGRASFSVASKIMTQICLGLEEAHNVGIIHRDLKTDNILLQNNFQRPDWVKIVDFGISHLSQHSKRLTRAGKVLGTPEYMAPEQFRDKPLDTRLDIYALGVLLFEVLTGKPPYESESPEVLMMKHLMEEPPPLMDIRKDSPAVESFDKVIRKAMKKEPNDRYQTAAELRLAVEAAYRELFAAGGT
jgi:eukaryotic-like serine/threonine-protein kinase